MRSSEELASLMASYVPSPDVQLRQTRFRQRLVDEWKIEAGARVLEIGCGQGDTTAVLADAVGPEGYVLATDVADPSYGAPVSLGDSARVLREGPLGDRIEFRFEFDVLSHSTEFAEDEFDCVVLSHCSWYFESLDQLRRTLEKVRPWGRRLCLSEWDLQPRSPAQLAHFLAISIQAQLEAFKTASTSNVRTPYARDVLLSLLADEGWLVESDVTLDASDLDDGCWEVAMSFENAEREAGALPTKLRHWVESQLRLLERLRDAGEVQSLPSYAIVARK